MRTGGVLDVGQPASPPVQGTSPYDNLYPSRQLYATGYPALTKQLKVRKWVWVWVGVCECACGT